MFFISTARAEANCSALIALGAWEVTLGVEAVFGSKPGISQFLFLFRLFCCFSCTLFPALEDAILVSETTGNRFSGFVYRIVRKSGQYAFNFAQPCFPSKGSRHMLRFSVNRFAQI